MMSVGAAKAMVLRWISSKTRAIMQVSILEPIAGYTVREGQD